MKLFVLSAIAFAIAALTIVSVVTYRAWTTDRFDDTIREAASGHNLPFGVIKAFVKHQSGFDPTARTLEGKGLILVPDPAVDDYYEGHGLEGPRLVCLNQRFPNHAAVKDVRYDPRLGVRVCPVRGCRMSLVEEIMDPPFNIEVGCWYLARLRDRIAADIHPREEDTLPWALLAYRVGYEALYQQTSGFRLEVTPEMKQFLKPIYDDANKYQH